MFKQNVFCSKFPPILGRISCGLFCTISEVYVNINRERFRMIRFLLKLIGASVLVLWWVVSGFFKKIVDILKLLARIKKIFLAEKENPNGRDS